MSAYIPAVQSLHCTVPTTSLYWPGLHGVQVASSAVDPLKFEMVFVEVVSVEEPQEPTLDVVVLMDVPVAEALKKP